jgi:sec-independent protein translocase protein TatB
MFGVDFSELALVFVVALVVLGPTRLPGLVRKVGLWVGKARSMARQFREQLENEVNLEELNRMTEMRAKTAQPAYPPPPPGFGGEPMPETPGTAPTGTAAPPEEPVYDVPPPGDASHDDLSDPVYEPPAQAAPEAPTPPAQDAPHERPG